MNKKYEKLSNLIAAIEDCDMAISLDPADSYPYYNRGNVKLRSGKFAEALSEWIGCELFR